MQPLQKVVEYQMLSHCTVYAFSGHCGHIFNGIQLGRNVIITVGILGSFRRTLTFARRWIHT